MKASLNFSSEVECRARYRTDRNWIARTFHSRKLISIDSSSKKSISLTVATSSRRYRANKKVETGFFELTADRYPSTVCSSFSFNSTLRAIACQIHDDVSGPRRFSIAVSVLGPV